MQATPSPTPSAKLEYDPTARGIAAAQGGRMEEAITHFSRAVDAQPDNPVLLCNLGLALIQVQRLDAARTVLERALASAPHHAPALFLLGNIDMSQQHWAAARTHYTEALARHPDDVSLLRNRAVALLHSHDLDGARADCVAVLALDPQHEPTWRNLGLIERERGDLAASLAAYDRAVALDPRNPVTHTDRANTLLLAGDFVHGWEDYAWRWRKPLFALPPSVECVPLWSNQSLRGHTLLLHSEQGLGDTLQFCRYVPALATHGCQVVLAVQPSLVALLQAHYANLCTVCAVNAPLPPCDYRCALLDLPQRLGATTEPFLGAPGYLHADPVRMQAWCRAGADTSAPRVGLAWRGSQRHPNDLRRSLTLPTVLHHLPAGPQYVSLQVDATPAEQAALCARADITAPDWSQPDWRDTAALVATLDRVVTVDTSIAHMAGALGTPTWVLLPYAPDWRWQLHRTDSPWYASVRLWRQSTPGNWQAPLAALGQALADETRARHAPQP